MIRARTLNTYKGKTKIKYDDGTEPSVIDVKTLCEHTDKCPLLACLGKQQLKLWQALRACDMQTILSMDWIIVYQALKTFEVLGLIICHCEIVSYYQLSKIKLKLVDKTCNCILYNNNITKIKNVHNMNKNEEIKT